MKRFWPFTFSFIFYAAIAFVLPFIVLYYQGLGFTGPQIGLLTGITPLVTFISAPLCSRLADAKNWHCLIMSLAILSGVLILCIYPFFNSFLPVLLCAVFLSVFGADHPLRRQRHDEHAG